MFKKLLSDKKLFQHSCELKIIPENDQSGRTGGLASLAAAGVERLWCSLMFSPPQYVVV